MSRFYGPGKQPIKPGYQPREGSAQRMVKPPPATPAIIFIRFVLKSGAMVELNESTLDEVVDSWADRMFKAICGTKADGTKALVPVDSVDYMEEVQ